jgi:hypothetical protein
MNRGVQILMSETCFLGLWEIQSTGLKEVRLR